MNRGRIEQALEQAMEAQLRVYAFVPILLAALYFLSASIEKNTDLVRSITFSAGIVVSLLIIAGVIMRAGQLAWRTKVIAYIVPLLPAALLSYFALGTYAAAYVGVYLTLMVASLALNKRYLWSIASIATIGTLVISFTHYQGLDAGTLPPHLETVWDDSMRMTFTAFVYLLGLLLGVFLLLPPVKALSQISDEQAALNRQVSMLELGVNSSKTALFTRLSGFTVELDQDNRLCNLSLEAQNQLKEQTDDPKPYGETKLATVKVLPELIDAARTTGSTYTATLEPGLISRQACKLTVTPYLTNQGSQHLILTAASTLTQHVESTPLLAQALSQYLTSTQEISGELTFIGYRCCESAEQRDEFKGVNVALKRMIDQSGAFSYQFLGQGSIGGYLAALHLNRAGQEAFRVMLKHLHQVRSKTDTPLSLVLLQQHITPSEFHLVAAQALKLKAYLESHNRPEFFEAPQDINAKWSRGERDRLKQGLINNDIGWSIVDTVNSRDDLPPVKELKLLWRDKTQPEKKAEELIIALENLGLSNALARIHSTQLLPMIKLGQDRSSVDNIALLVPEKILLNLANFSAMSSLLMDSDIVPERLWLRIHESSASQLTPEHWQKLEDLKSKGFRFALGEVGAGDTDIKLLAHPLFDMAHFSRAMTKAAAESTRASVIFEAGLEIAQSLKLSTMAKAVNEPLYLNYLKASGVDYIDIA